MEDVQQPGGLLLGLLAAPVSLVAAQGVGRLGRRHVVARPLGGVGEPGEGAPASSARSNVRIVSAAWGTSASRSGTDTSIDTHSHRGARPARAFIAPPFLGSETGRLSVPTVSDALIARGPVDKRRCDHPPV